MRPFSYSQPGPISLSPQTIIPCFYYDFAKRFHGSSSNDKPFVINSDPRPVPRVRGIPQTEKNGFNLFIQKDFDYIYDKVIKSAVSGCWCIHLHPVQPVEKTMPMNSLTLPSYAKINLGLLLRGKRDDGFHDIETIFQQVDLHDRLIFRKIPTGIRIRSTDARLPLDGRNLVFRAFDRFRDKVGSSEGLEVHIEKCIPVGSGLGGGSSNAAVTLVASNRLWGEPFTRHDLHEIAVEIGSDTPFFLMGGTARGQGRGEILTPLDWAPDWWIVLVCPDIEVSTAWAYRHSKIPLTKDEKFTKFSSIFNRMQSSALSSSLHNDLEGVVFKRHPTLQEIKECLYARDAFYASMSGSGSSIFGLFSEQETAEEAKSFFGIQKKMTVHLCRPVSSSADTSSG